MAKILLLSVVKECTKEENLSNYISRISYRAILKSASRDNVKEHSLADDPNLADIILFAEGGCAGPYYELVKRHPYVNDFREKCFLFTTGPMNPIPFLPGIYTSIEKRQYNRNRTRTGFYPYEEEDKVIKFYPDFLERKYLFSFVGSLHTHPVRKKLANLEHARGYIKDTKGVQIQAYISWDVKKIEELKKTFAESINNSKFILCPRGASCSSMRLFESMKMGRAPVIISDQWVPPEGPCWNEFSIRVSEKDVGQIPGILEKNEERSLEMGMLARKEWERWFSIDMYFHNIAEWCLDMKKNRKIPESLHRFFPYMELLRPFHFKNYIKTRIQLFKEHKKIIL